MHRRVVNELTVELEISPVGPVLVKAAGIGADPTRPDVEFVRTHRDGVDTAYLPGSSLKGALRAQCERIARTVGGTTSEGRPRLSCNPLTNTGDGPNYSCNRRLVELASQSRGRDLGGQRAYRESCVVCRLFGNTATAAHVAVDDAYPTEPVRAEARTGVAVDRIYGSVAEGPFSYEVVTEAQFATRLRLHNFAIGQIGLLALALRDLTEGRLALGAGKSRGLGRVALTARRVSVRYPGCTVGAGALTTLAGAQIGTAERLYGVGAFADTAAYGFPAPDDAPWPGPPMAGDGWASAGSELSGAEFDALWRTSVARWAEQVRGMAEAS